MTKRALAIGVSEYPRNPGKQALPGCRNDAQRIYGMLSNEWDFDDTDDTKGLLIDSETEFISARTLASRIAEHFQVRPNEAIETLDLLLFYSGHVGATKDGLALQAADGPSILLSALAGYIFGFQQVHSVTVILDCCHAGGLKELLDAATDLKMISILAACAKDERTFSAAAGRFTTVLCDALGREDQQIPVTVGETIDRLRAVERFAAESLGSGQYESEFRSPHPDHDPILYVPVSREPIRGGRLQVDQAAQTLSVFRIDSRTGALTPWRHHFRIGSGEQALAVTAAGRRDAYVALASGTGAAVLRLAPDGRITRADVETPRRAIAADLVRGRGGLELHLVLADEATYMVPLRTLRFATLEG